MAQSESAKVEIPALNQVGVVVKDIEETVKNYWNMFGIGPWTILEMKAPVLHHEVYHGKPAPCEFKAAFAQVGDCELELMQTVKGPTAYEDFLKVHGEGAHHLQYIVDSVAVIDEHIKKFEKFGFHCIGGARFGDNGGFNYIDTTSALKAIWEPVKMADEFTGSMSQYPEEESAVSPSKIKIKAITQIGIVVKNLEETIQNYWDILGIGPWDICEVRPPTLHDQMYYGKPGNFTFRVSFVNVGPIQLELLQPVSGDNVYSDFLAEHGEDIHHIQFTVDDIDETTKMMTQEGFPQLMGAGFSDGAFAYYDTVKPLKCIWEAFQPPTIVPPMSQYPK